MDRGIRSAVERMKRKNHNIFGISDGLFCFVCCALIGLWVCALADVALSGLPMLQRVLAGAGIILICSAAVVLRMRRSGRDIVPYSRHEGFEFLGLHNLRGAKLGDSTDVLQRTEEVACMKRVLEDVIFPQSTVKQALCLIGPSGCGKSTILSYFCEQYGGKDYLCCDFSGNYHELESAMCKRFGNNLDVELSKLAAKQKVVIILDQFERFFFLESEQQLSVRRVIRALCCKNTAVILSLREEYLADFLKQFDMNDLKSDPTSKEKALSQGIFRELMSIIWKTKGQPAHNGLIRPAQTIVWSDSKVKNNGKVYLNSPFSHASQAVLEQMGITLFYCQNENSATVQVNGVASTSTILLDKCKKLFGAAGEAFYSRHKRAVLIEQQILFHMAEFNQKIYQLTSEELLAMFEKSNTELLNEYFDIQLAACEDYFIASRLLYLYSRARMNQVFIKTDAVEHGLFPNLFEKKGHKKLLKALDQLEELQLIRRNIDGSGQEYEIAHDFIAQAFLKYCENSMDRGVKNALDLFLSEYVNEDLKDALEQKYAHQHRALQDPFYRCATAVAVGAMIVGYFVEAAIWNPWTTIWARFNPYGGYLPFLPLIVTIISVIYLCSLYDRMVKYFRGRKVWQCKCRFALLMILATAAVLAYPHFLFLDSLDLVVAALDICFLLDRSYHQNCRAQLRSYGIRSTMIGSIFMLAHALFWATNRAFGTYLIFAELAMFSFLVAYATAEHLSKDYLYARMIDASSEKV